MNASTPPPRKRENNTNVAPLMQILSIPRLNGSDALKSTRLDLSKWLNTQNISHHVHRFRLYPYFIEIGGLWLLTTVMLLTASIWLRWGWPSLVIATVSLVVIVVEMRGIPLLSRVIADIGENIVIEFEPQGKIEQEVILSAHYDSKTELLNDTQRAFFMNKLPISMGIVIFLGLIGTLNNLLKNPAEWWSVSLYLFALLLSMLMLILLVPIAINAIFGRFASPSQGVVDNGAGCTILLSIAKHLAAGDIDVEQTKVTIVLFCGEEVIVQGSRAYVADRDFPYPTIAINFDLMGQPGDYVVWKEIGSPLQKFPADVNLNKELRDLVLDKTNTELLFRKGPIGTDTLPFLVNGIRATTIGSMDQILGFGGLHTSKDNLTRITSEKIEESTKLLISFLMLRDAK